MRVVILFVSLSLYSSCGVWNSVPMVDEIGQFEMGSTVKVLNKKGNRSRGELLTVGTDNIVLLNKHGQIKITKKDNIRELKILLSYTHSNKRTGDSDLIGLMTIGHGWWFILTLPINAITIGSLNKSAYIIKYRDDINWKNVTMYARFPRGLPTGVNLFDLEGFNE